MASAKGQPKMDDLLHKLRRSIAELSLQGDDFTRQMWHMYNTFEDVVVGAPNPDGDQQQHQHQPRPASAGDSATSVPGIVKVRQESPSPARTVKPLRVPSTPDVRRDSSSSPSASPIALRKKRPMSQRCTYAACQRAGAGTTSSNPLLDTIGSMTYDPCCESDDYYDLASVYLQRRQLRHSDGESIGYAGSIDSGYKSLCPTPEIPDYDGTAQQGDAKPKILMGTRLMATKSPKPTQQELDADLDHLMQLRQSLLTAIARCESPASPKSPRTPTATDKTVRFSTEKTPTSKRKSTPSSVVGKTKPILKDPLCVNLRANLERPDSGGTLEEEIDSLLCGKPDYYDLDARFPPSTYVTMIEEKYRCNPGYSVAKVKCLKEKCQETCKDHNHATLLPMPEPSRRSQQPTQHPTPQEPQLQQQPHQRPSPHGPLPAPEATATADTFVPATSSWVPQHQAATAKAPSESSRPTLMRSAKSRFNEVAKCMLEIIEDLQHKKVTDQPRSSKPKQPASPAATASATTTHSFRDIYSGKRTVPPQRPLSDSEYHVYEEVLYDFVNSTGTTSDSPRPPPLPARPVDPGNRPKQRSNLYSLVRNQEERRNISKSLEQERGCDKASLDDEYGFRSPASS